MTATPGLAFVTIVGTLAFLGLAVLGEGGFAAFFSQPALTALAIATFVLSGSPVAGLASPSSPPEARCGSGQSLSSAVGSAGW